MSAELTMLFFSLLLLGAHLGVQAMLYRMQYGVMFVATSRDDEAPRNVWNGRAERALRNFMETWPAFIVLVLVLELGHRGDALTFWGAQVWFWARWVYIPLYLFGVVNIRSLVWTISALGLMAMFLGVLT